MKRKRLIAAVFAVMAVAACTAFGKADVKAAEIPQEVKEAVDTEGLKSVYETLFDEDLEKQGVQVVSPDEAQGVPVAITELSNGKKAYSVDGKPFYPIAVETGWWDTRVDDNGKMSSNQADVGDNFKNVTDREWNSYFSDMKNMGFNTVQLMIYWEDWEPQQGEYDFSFLDHVTGLAAENGLKTEMIIFFHSQTDNIPRIKDTFWGYNMDNQESGGEKYALSMQWGNNLTSAEDIRAYRDQHGNSAAGIENFLEYWHPEVFKGMTDALTALGEHYKDSSNIVGYQIGNEEGFNYYVDGGDDKNPYYTKLYEFWQQDHPGESKDKFRADTINNLWKCFSNALHKGDPYKPTTTNTQSGSMEKSGIQYPNHAPDGMTMDIYKSVDMIGSMFYGGASSIYTNLDQVYQNSEKTAYAKGFPILFPTEISGTMNDGNVAKMITAQTIARGGQGIGIYCYGEFYNDFEQNLWSSPKPVLGTVKTMVSTLHDVEDVIWSSVPVTSETTSNMYMTIDSVSDISNTGQGNPELSVLQSEEGKMLGVLHFWGNANDSGAGAKEQRTVNVSFEVKEAGTYKVELHKTDGSIDVRNVKFEEGSMQQQMALVTTGCDVTYIVAEKTDSEIPSEKVLTGIDVVNMPNKVSYAVDETFSTSGIKVRAHYSDGSATLLSEEELEFSEPDMTTEGTQEVTVTYQGFKTAFKITVQEAQYVTNLVEAPGSTGGLRSLFDGNLNTAAGYVADDETMEGIKAGEYYIQYNFDKKVLFDGVSLSTNYAVDQAILEFRLAVLSEDGSWVFLGEDENQVHRVNWETNDSNIETQKVSIDPVAADKVRMYVTDVANRWKDNAGGTVHKFEMSEIQFHFSELPEVTGIYIKELPEKTEYAVGEQLDTTGLVVMSVYSDGSEQDISDQVEISGFDASSEGEKKIQVDYEGKWKAAFSVTVCVPEKLIVIPPDKTVYMIGEELDLTGIQVFSELPSGRRIQIPAEEVQISGADFSTEGEKTIQISCQGVTAEFKVTVQAQEDKPDQGEEPDQGNNSDQGNKPDQQNKPTVTDNGKKPADASASGVSSGQKALKTGDTASPVILLGVLLATSVIAGTLLYRRVRK